jgi:hypothetical protein
MLSVERAAEFLDESFGLFFAQRHPDSPPGPSINAVVSTLPDAPAPRAYPLSRVRSRAV